MKVLVTGGESFNPAAYTPACALPNPHTPCPLIIAVSSTEVWDPATGAWSPGPAMPFPTAGHDQITLPSGRVLVISGEAPTACMAAPWPDGVRSACDKHMEGVSSCPWKPGA